MRRLVFGLLALILALTGCVHKTGDHGWEGEIEWRSATIAPPHCWTKKATISRTIVTVVEQSCDRSQRDVVRTLKTSDVEDVLGELHAAGDHAFAPSGRDGGQTFKIHLQAPSGRVVSGTAVEPQDLEPLIRAFEKLR